MPREKSRRTHSLTQKLAIVRESFAAGASTAEVAHRHGIHANMLYRWRKTYRGMIDVDLAGSGEAPPSQPGLDGLRLQVRNLERLLGQRTLEIALLRERLESSREQNAKA